ncbi:MAG: hemolysin III family protein [Clostridia bacterium]|nr:hemolysin III family protein [Clostridia bacterium]
MTTVKKIQNNLPNYTVGEERFHMISHIVGGGIGIFVLVICVLISASKGDAYGVVGSAVYGATFIALYAMSSIYHGLKPPAAKRVMRILDHCTIYFLISGTYTPILLTAIRKEDPTVCWLLMGLLWGLTALAVTLTAVNMKKYSAFSMVCYIVMGWSIVLAPRVAFAAIPINGLVLLLAGGIAYTVGAVIYGIGKKHRYMHSVFHVFVVIGSVLQFLCIALFVL